MEDHPGGLAAVGLTGSVRAPGHQAARTHDRLSSGKGLEGVCVCKDLGSGAGWRREEQQHSPRAGHGRPTACPVRRSAGNERTPWVNMNARIADTWRLAGHVSPRTGLIRGGRRRSLPMKCIIPGTARPARRMVRTLAGLLVKSPSSGPRARLCGARGNDRPGSGKHGVGWRPDLSCGINSWHGGYTSALVALQRPCRAVFNHIPHESRGAMDLDGVRWQTGGGGPLPGSGCHPVSRGIEGTIPDFEHHFGFFLGLCERAARTGSHS